MASERAAPELRSLLRDPRLPTWLLGAYIVVALPALLLVLGRHWWFYWDEWSFLSGRDVSVDGLFRPHNQSHLTALPVLLYRGLWNVVGARHYMPYQVPVVLLHLGIVVLVYLLARRSGVRRSLAAAAAATLVLFSPGRFNIVWGFQVTYNGATFFLLLQVLLLERQGPFGRRDVLGLACGLVGVLCAGTSTALLLAVGTVAVVRRGWRVAAFHVLPLVAVVATWGLAFDATTTSPSGPGRPASAWMTVRWARWAVQGTFEAIGHGGFVALGLVVLACFGLTRAGVLAARALRGGQGRSGRVRAVLDPYAIPLGLLVAAFAYTALTARGRWFLGRPASTSSQSLHLLAVLLVPVIAVGAEALAERWRGAVVVAVVLLLAPLPFNARGFRGGRTTPAYFEDSRTSILGTAANPLSPGVVGDLHPAWWELQMGWETNVGFLLDAADDGRFGSLPTLDAAAVERSSLQLLLARQFAAAPTDCEAVDAPAVIAVERGDVLVTDSVIRVSFADSTLDDPPFVTLSPVQLDVRALADARLLLEPSPSDRGASRLRICH